MHIFVNLKETFGSVHHDILCDNIKASGLRGNKRNLLKSYRRNRKRHVSIDNHDPIGFFIPHTINFYKMI